MYSLAPSSYVAAVQTKFPGWLEKQIQITSESIDARLSLSRYATPFASPYPETVKAWVGAIVSPDLMIKRGVNQADKEYTEIALRGSAANSEIDNAASASGNRYNLPLRADLNTSAVSKGFPRVYSEQSPYVHLSTQRDVGRREDYARKGSSS